MAIYIFTNCIVTLQPPPVLPIARLPFVADLSVVHDLGDLTIHCSDCHALHWLAEKLAGSSVRNPRFGMCCTQGKISLPPLHHPPPELSLLLVSQEDEGIQFRKNIRNYNNALAMTSVGRHLDNSLNAAGGGAYSFRLHGELIHKAGSLLPEQGQPPVYAQLWISDTADAANAAHNARMANSWNTNLNSTTLRTLQDMLFRTHHGVHQYKQAFELTRVIPPERQCRIALRFDTGCDRRRYQAPDASVREIAVILPGDGDQVKGSQDIILYRNFGPPLQRISDIHPLYPSLRYVLLFPTGQLGWFPNIPYHIQQGKRAHVSMAQYYRYRLFIRPTDVESNHIFLTCNLYQEYVCETWAIAEQNRLNWIRFHQKELRVDVYKGLVDAVAADADADWNQLGTRFILPSSFTGSTRHMQQLCQDALAINRYYGGGDLFITMTANPAWPEIQSALLHGQTANDRPDLTVRAFRAKLQSLIKDISKGVLGDVNAYLYTIEFQKRGLPHAHIIVFLKPHAKLRSPEDIDTLMSSEFPENNADLLELVKRFMVHKPCGDQNPNSPCMVKGKCSKSFPKQFREDTFVTDDAYACTRCRNTGQTHQLRGGVQVDNRWVVCHSRYLIWRYRCHINVESIASVKAIKYIYKYVYKGHDRTTMEFGTCRDEIKQYLDARYVSSCEAHWRLYLFAMQEHHPAVVRLQVHLPDQQSVIFNPEAGVNVQEVLASHADRDTTLTGWFRANAESEANRDLLYQDFPSRMVWSKKTHKWTPRKQNYFAIGRMYHAHPTSGERFYLRLLLTCVKGATSFLDICTFEGTEYLLFRDACRARGLLEDDHEWHQCLTEASHMAVGHQLRHLFVSILRDCTPAAPRELWDTFAPHICDDLRRLLLRLRPQFDPSDADILDYGLYLIDKLLSYTGKRLREWEDMPLIVKNWGQIIGNPFIIEQRDYDPQREARLAEEHIATFTQDQQSAFEKITSAINTGSGETFFLHGPGGTGKTYLYNTLCNHLRSQNKIVLCVASSGIAALLLKGGRTAHSRFKIPIPSHESSVCSIPKNSHLAELICEAELVIWDEAPMQHRHNMETVDRTLQDLRNSDKAFGGVTFVFGGDFQQILPVIPNSSRGQTVGACLQRSVLWGSITVLHLRQNMRLDTRFEEERQFAQWQLEVGQGMHTDEDCNISLPHYMKCRENTVDSLIDTIYPDISTLNVSIEHLSNYFSERTVLSTLNVDVDSLNKTVLAKFPGQVKVFHSADFIPTSEQSGEEDPLLNYPVEYLNEINCSGLPLAKLELKIGCPVMILRNLDPAHGVCNGSRGILTRWANRVLEIQLLTGEHAGTKVFIPRIPNQPTADQVAFKFTRKQFPVRLCFAMTINKSQGQSVQHVGLDLRSPVFTHGQFYVGVSRVTSWKNIKVIWSEAEAEGRTKNIVFDEVLLKE